MSEIRPENIAFEEAAHKNILVALSGGADSVALLVLMARAAGRNGMRISAAHLNHMIRGADADSDQAFCASLCDALHIPLIVGRIDVPRIARDTALGMETAARDARYRFLNEAADQCGAELIALAHHLDDQTETVLMHLFRGAGLEGISGMTRLSGRLYRPLLDVRKRALEQYLIENGFSWRTDGTNAVADTPRNALRLNVMPEIEKSYPSAGEAIARMAKIARVESDYVARMARQYLDAHLISGSYGRKLAFADPPDEAILRRALKLLCGRDTTAARIERLIALAGKRRGREEINRDLYALRTPTGLYLLPKEPIRLPDVPLNADGETEWGGYAIRAESGDFEIAPDDPLTEIVSADVLRGACVRGRRPGDRFHPLGAKGDRLLSDFFTDRRTELPLRDGVPLIAVGSRVLWVCGMMLSDEAKITENTGRRMRLTLLKLPK